MARCRWRRATGFAAALLVGAMAAAQPAGPPARVRIDSVRMETVERRREVTGEIVPVRRALIASKEAGQVVELPLDVGASVEQGDVLARLDDELRRLELDQLNAQVASQQAQVAEREAALAKARRDLDRLRELVEREGASANERDDAQTELDRATARLNQAKADLDSTLARQQTARARLDDMVIRAPFAGSMVSKGTEVGQWVREGDTVVELVELARLDAYLDVPERFLPQLRAKDVRVQLRIAALGTQIEAAVSSIVAQGDRLARTFPVRLRLDNSKGLLQPGMSVIGLVPTGEPMRALTVHKDALMQSEIGPFVWYDSDGRAAVAPIEPLFAIGERLVVRSSVLREGTGVIVEGNERLGPGQSLLIDVPTPPSSDAERARANPVSEAQGG